MKANEVALELALYFEECKRIDAVPRIDKLEAMVMQYSPTISGVFPSVFTDDGKDNICAFCGEPGAFHAGAATKDGAQKVHGQCCLVCQSDQNKTCPQCGETRKLYDDRICHGCYIKNENTLAQLEQDKK